ncbi:MAG: GNAT family protein [Actinomycetota bacterium]
MSGRGWGHPSAPSGDAIRLYGARVLLRPLVATDWEQWRDVRHRNDQWLTPWEPLRPQHLLDPTRDREAFVSRCTARERDRQMGTAFGFGLFVGADFAGEVNLNSIARGALQGGTVGYWIDQAKAGNRYVAEAVVVLARFGFEQLHLHRLEICIVPRNVNSRRVMEVLAIREEGTAHGYLEINGVWEDHVRYGITVEEWEARAGELTERWL